jgi:putative transposase
VKLDGFIEAEKADRRSVKRCCELFEVSRSAYYQRASATPSTREVSDADLAVEIREIHRESKAPTGHRESPPSCAGAATTSDADVLAG